MQSKATTVEQYLKELDPERRAGIEAVREVILKNMDKKGGLREGMSYGMIGYCIPHSVYPPGYHCDPKLPLPYAGLASQKGHFSLYMMGLPAAEYGSAYAKEVTWFRNAWAKSGKKPLDMGKVCIRFKKVDDIPLDVIGEAFRRIPVQSFIEHYEKALAKSAVEAAERKAARDGIKGLKTPSKTPGKKVAKKTATKVAKKAGAKKATKKK